MSEPSIWTMQTMDVLSQSLLRIPMKFLHAVKSGDATVRYNDADEEIFDTVYTHVCQLFDYSTHTVVLQGTVDVEGASGPGYRIDQVVPQDHRPLFNQYVVNLELTVDLTDMVVPAKELMVRIVHEIGRFPSLRRVGIQLLMWDNWEAREMDAEFNAWLRNITGYKPEYRVQLCRPVHQERVSRAWDV